MTNIRDSVDVPEYMSITKKNVVCISQFERYASVCYKYAFCGINGTVNSELSNLLIKI